MPSRHKVLDPATAAPLVFGLDGSPFAADGYDRTGHDRGGFNRAGLHRDTNERFNPDGYDRSGRRRTPPVPASR